MRVIKSLKSLREWQLNHLEAEQPWAMVPTMGNLHAGHESLMRKAKTHCATVIATIYVNPTQFGDNEDFADYPRTPEQDIECLERLGVNAVLMPTEEMIYPFGQEQMIGFDLPASYTQILCGKRRPTHFQGVVAVVSRLFNLVQPKYAIFGDKDFQQQWIIRRMVADLHFSINIIGAPIVREKSGLALSSRNQYLTEHERIIAPQLHQEMQQAVEKIKAGCDIKATINKAEKILTAQGFRMDYLELRRQDSLKLIEQYDGQDAVLLAAAYLGKPRLLDNIVF